LLFHLLSKLCERTTTVIIKTNLSFGKWAAVFNNPKMKTAQLDRLTHCCHILETGNDGFFFKKRLVTAAKPQRTKHETWGTPDLEPIFKPGQFSTKTAGQISAGINMRQ
jgi:IstB-like ATP binding protein